MTKELKTKFDKNSVDIRNKKQMRILGERNKEQLTKAKEIIKRFLEFVNNEVEYDPEHPKEHTDLWNELCKEAEQFLKGE